MRIIERDFSCKIFKVIEVLDRSGEIGKIKRTHYFKTLDELDLHLRNIRKGYPQFEFIPKFRFLLVGDFMFDKLRNLVKGQPSFDLSLSKNYSKKELDMITLLLKDNPER